MVAGDSSYGYNGICRESSDSWLLLWLFKPVGLVEPASLLQPGLLLLYLGEIEMTAYTGANLRSSGGYWELSGPAPLNQTATCRACRVSMPRGESVMCRDGRKLRFFYHVRCFTGGADPRSQEHRSVLWLVSTLSSEC